MFKTFRFTRKVENTLMFIFIGLFLAFCSASPDMSVDSLKSVLLIGITVGIIYGLVAVGISLIYTGLDIVNFSHGEFFMLGAFTGLTVYNFIVDGELIYAIFPEAYGWIAYVIGLFFCICCHGFIWCFS
jgi:branched-chain amino acid transport system permease protein